MARENILEVARRSLEVVREQGEIKADAQKLMAKKPQLVADLTKELIRVTAKKYLARRKGRRSKANINIKRLGKKYGVSGEGYGIMDMVAGNVLLGTALRPNAPEPELRKAVDQVVTKTLDKFGS